MRLVHSHAISHHGIQYQNPSSISTGDIKKGIIIWGLEPPSPYIPGGDFLHPEGGLVHSHNSGKFQLSSSINFEDGQGPQNLGS